MEADIEIAPAFSVWERATDQEVASVMSAMREEDRIECAAWGLTPNDAARAFVQCEHTWVVYQRQYPVFVFGLKQHTPGSYFLVGFGATDIEKCTLRKLTRWGCKEWMPMIFYEIGARRVEALIPTVSTHSLNWLTWIGMRLEGRARDFMKRGEDFFRLAYTITDFESTETDVHVFSAEDRPGDTPREIVYGDSEGN